MGIQNPKNIGGHIKLVQLAVAQAFTAGTTSPGTANKTPSYDRQGDGYPQSMTLHLNAGVTSSNPSVATVKAVVYDSPDNSTWTAYVPPPKAGVAQTSATGGTTSTLDCSSTYAATELDVDLSGADRYISVQLVHAFTGGTSPAIPTAVSAAFGGAPVEPI